MQRSHAVVAVLALAVSACSDLQSRNPGQTSFESAPSWGVPADLITPARPASPGYAPRAPIYRLEGNRLYLLNGYRGLLVFDVTDIDHPRLIGRSSIAGWPVEMVVRNGIATVVLADWYGQDDDGTPFYGSLIRGLDATDAAHIRTLGDVRLAGWIREARVVGDVLHTVSHPVEAIWDRVRHIEAPAIMVVSSVNFAGGTVRKVAERSYPGSVVVAIHANVNAILVARGSATSAAAPIRLTYLDISDQTGILVERGSIDVPGLSSLDFSDGKTARAFYCDQGCRSTAQPWHLALVDFSNPDSPVQASQLAGESISDRPLTARFDSQRMYLWRRSLDYLSTDLKIFDLIDRARPLLVSEIEMAGRILEISPLGNTLLSVARLGAGSPREGPMAVSSIDITDLAHPTVTAITTFGEGWTWAPDADTFKPVVQDSAQGLIALPFSAWDLLSQTYRNGLQLLEWSAGSFRGAGLSLTRGWIEQGFFTGGRLIGLSDVSLSVIDPSDHQSPRISSEQPVAINTTRVVPMGDFVAEFSGDFWGKDPFWTSVRLLPLAEADEPPGHSVLSEIQIDGVEPTVFRNGSLLYVVSVMRLDAECNHGTGCSRWAPLVQVLDLSGGRARLRSKLIVPVPWQGWLLTGPGWMLDIAYGSELSGHRRARQVGADILAFPVDLNDLSKPLVIVDLSNPDAPNAVTMKIADGMAGSWGYLTVQGDTLYATEVERVTSSTIARRRERVWLDRIDLSDRAHPRVTARVNVPGILVEVPEGDPSLLHVIGTRWGTDEEIYSLDLLRLHGDRAELLGSVDLDGFPGRIFVNGDSALVSVGKMHEGQTPFAAYQSQTLKQLDLGDLRHPSARVIDARESRRWLLGVEGDLALFSSGWSGTLGLDVCRLSPDGPPRLERFLNARSSTISRQGNDLFIASGPWGVESIRLGN